jgi:hypothetical protein
LTQPVLLEIGTGFGLFQAWTQVEMSPFVGTDQRLCLLIGRDILSGHSALICQILRPANPAGLANIFCNSL